LASRFNRYCVVHRAVPFQRSADRELADADKSPATVTRADVTLQQRLNSCQLRARS
jgi:hypothetical protein